MSEPPTTTLQRRSFETSDQLEAREFFDQLFGGTRLRLRGGVNADWGVSVLDITVGRVAVCNLRLPADLQFGVDGGGDVVIDTVLGGSVEVEKEFDERYVAGDVFVGRRPAMSNRSRCRGFRAHTVTIPEAVFLEVTDGTKGRHSSSDGMASQADRDGAKRWQQVTSYVDGLLAPDSGVAEAPLVLGQIERLLAASALSFIGGEADEPSPKESRDAHSDTLRRAIAFIEANPGNDISSGDIARAAYATTRTIQLAFRRHLDTTPMAYLRRVRLGHAHEALLAAGPHDGNTVARIALDWGFVNPSRFAAYYREAYGTAPSKTLAR